MSLPTPPSGGGHHPPTQQQKSVAYLKKVWRNSIRKIPSFAGLAPRPSSHDLHLKTDSTGPSASPRWEPTMRKYASVPNLLAGSCEAEGRQPFRLGQKSLDIVAEEQMEHPPPLPAASPVLKKQESSSSTVAEPENLISDDAQSEAQHPLLPLPGTIIDNPSVCIETPSPMRPAPIALAESRSYVNARSSSETEVFVSHEEEVSVNEYSYSDDGSYEDIDEIADVLVEQDRDRGRDDDDDDSDEDSFLQRALRRRSWRSIYTGAGSIKSTASTPWIDVEDEDPVDAAYERRRKRRSRRSRATRSIMLVDVERLANEAATAPQQITNAVPARSPTSPGSDGTFGPSLAVRSNRHSRTLRSLSSREALLRMHRKVTLNRVQSEAGESLLPVIAPPPPSDVIERGGRGDDSGARDSYLSSFTSRSRASIIELDSQGQSKRHSHRRGSAVSSRRTRSRSRSRSRSSRRPGPPSRAGTRLSIQSHSSLLTLYDKILQHYTWTDDMMESNDDDDDDDETASHSGGGTTTETSSVATKLDELLGDLADWGRDASTRKSSARRASLRRISRALIAEALREVDEISESGEDFVREDFIENAIDEIDHLARSVSAARPSPLPVPPPSRSLSSSATRPASPPPPTPLEVTSPIAQLPDRAPRSDASGSSPRLSQSTRRSSSSGNGIAIASPTSSTTSGGVVRAQGKIRIARVQHPDGRVTEGDALVSATEAGYDMDFSYAVKGPATAYLVTIHSEAAVAVPFTWEPALEVWRDDGSAENDQSRASAPKPTSLFCVTPARGWLPPRGDMVFEVELASTAELVSYDAVATLVLRHLDARDEPSPWASMTDLVSRTGTKPCEFLVRCRRAQPTADDTAQSGPTAVALPRRSLAISTKRTSIGMGVYLKKQKKNRFRKIFKKISRVVF
ncbi:hypothetical protein HDU88_000903 [Geranomyces variabilis]|nr:hypothetical protein HDU88_000903 [Geranomyces variabilis]